VIQKEIIAKVSREFSKNLQSYSAKLLRDTTVSRIYVETTTGATASHMRLLGIRVNMESSGSTFIDRTIPPVWHRDGKRVPRPLNTLRKDVFM
jgi:hypothetical protein